MIKQVVIAEWDPLHTRNPEFPGFCSQEHERSPPSTVDTEQVQGQPQERNLGTTPILSAGVINTPTQAPESTPHFLGYRSQAAARIQGLMQGMQDRQQTQSMHGESGRDAAARIQGLMQGMQDRQQTQSMHGESRREAAARVQGLMQGMHARQQTQTNLSAGLMDPSNSIPNQDLAATANVTSDDDDDDFMVLDKPPPPQVHAAGTLVVLCNLKNKQYNQKRGHITKPLGSHGLADGHVGVALLSTVDGKQNISVNARNVTAVKSKSMVGTKVTYMPNIVTYGKYRSSMGARVCLWVGQ